MAGLLGCDVREVIFTSGGTESDNAAIHGVLAVRAPRRVIVTSTVEHSAVRTPVQALGKAGFEVVEIGVDEGGALDLDLLRKVLAERGAEVVRVVQAVRDLDLKKRPSVSETLDWVRALVLLNASVLDGKMVQDTLNLILKYEGDIDRTVEKLPEILAKKS